ncbi:10864_t:CDS:2 [Paraglomus occultum]|uniref:10864_t:CDS:1 n=1 Tax=Paraglomus occultum TaxID=144539 RepID=A0A9N9FNR8_9GLOM|nr:10864_t:CDS:2 [Paraglomus occultum]
MPKQNPYIIPIENKKPFETVYELKNEVPSFEEFMKNYEGNVNYSDLESSDIGSPKIYGPGDRDKGKSKSEGSGKYNQHLINTINDNTAVARTDLGGLGGGIIDSRSSVSFFRASDGEGNEVRFLSGRAGAELGLGLGGATAMAEAGFDLGGVEANGFQVRVGPNIDTGGSIGLGGVEVKVAGLGVSIGKKTGISTPLGEIAVDFEKCAVQ